MQWLLAASDMTIETWCHLADRLNEVAPEAVVIMEPERAGEPYVLIPKARA